MTQPRAELNAEPMKSRVIKARKTCTTCMKTHVLETRSFEGKIYRRRECLACKQRTVTVEQQVPKMPEGLQAGRKQPRGKTWAQLGMAVKHMADRKPRLANAR